jgi:phospholipase C
MYDFAEGQSLLHNANGTVRKMSMQTRRDFLKLAAIVSGAAGLIPEAIQRAYAIEPTPGSTFLDAEHIVILMQENRSFDHAFGTLRGVRGLNDPRALRLENGNSVFVQTDGAGNSYAPWRLDIRDTRITWMGSLPHSRHSQVDAWNEGLHDGWLEAKRSGEKGYSDLPLTMGHYTREDLPFYYALADAFTVCDQNYCSVMTSTSPNRCVFWTGTIRDRQRVDSKVHIRNEQIDDGGMTWKTFPERLQEAGVSWKSYQNELTRSGLPGEEDAWLSNFGDNVLECFNAYNVEAYPGFALAGRRGMEELSAYATKIEGEISAQTDAAAAAKLRAKLANTRSRIEAIKATLATSGEVRYQQLTAQEKALHRAAFVTNAEDPDYHALHSLPFEDGGKSQIMQVPKGDVLYQFRKDVDEGKLPTVSWLTASERFSDHPSSPWFGAWYVSEVMDILTKNPEIWKKTIFILTYDENDGYFDHAPSFVAADPKRPETGGASAGIDTGLEYTYKEDELRQGVEENEARSGPIGMGFRVPMIVASPWSRGGWVNSQVFDHTSTLMFLERFVAGKFGKNVREENISAWRRAISGDLTSIFRPYDPKEAALDWLDRDKFLVSIEKSRFKEPPSNFRKLGAEQIEQINLAPARSGVIARQETGIRPACAIPYELYADGNLSEDGTHYELRLRAANQTHESRSSGAPFNVYLRNMKDGGSGGKKMMSATYAVKPGDTLTRQIPLSMFADSRYSIEVHGPNGFYRSFTGRSNFSPLQRHTAYERQGARLTGNVLVRLSNRSTRPIGIAIKDISYKSKTVTREINAGEETSVVMLLRRSHGWYDFTVNVEGSDEEARYCGHVETGMPGTSDPLMGGVAE